MNQARDNALIDQMIEEIDNPDLLLENLQRLKNIQKKLKDVELLCIENYEQMIGSNPTFARYKSEVQLSNKVYERDLELRRRQSALLAARL